MKHAPLILGILAGIAGLMGSAFGLFVGGLSTAFNGDGGGIAAASAIAAALSVAGMVGAVMTQGKSRVGGYIMMIAGIDGLIAVSVGYIIAAPLFIIAAALALKQAKEAKAVLNKKQRWIFVGIGVAILALIISTNGSSQTGTGSTDSGASSNIGTAAQESLCPDIAKMATNYSFSWGETYGGNEHLYLLADFLKPMAFANDWKLDNLPDMNEFLPDNFPCELGSQAGQSTNKLYCDVTYMYEPKLIKNTVDADGNITDSDYRYITQFVFDTTGKNIHNAVDLKSLMLESYNCSETSL